ncbi:MAG TPA: methyltransferase domain-containing protein, partial [Gemmatimonadaceae bacterium]|nr:methyltransferase domain-containing protein [Gemmatimonadaceae bacterium]
AAARRRLAGKTNVEVRSGRLESLPIEDGSLDAALLFLVLHYVPEPEVAITEARRTLKPGGRLLIVDMMPHERDDLLQEMGHVWRGFSEQQITSMFEAAGLLGGRVHPLPPDEAAKGPTLFSAVARRANSENETVVENSDQSSGLALTA